MVGIIRGKGQRRLIHLIDGELSAQQVELTFAIRIYVLSQDKACLLLHQGPGGLGLVVWEVRGGQLPVWEPTSARDGRRLPLRRGGLEYFRQVLH